MKQWEQMEQWLFAYFDGEPRPGARFTSVEIAVSAGISRAKASRWIKSYLEAQRRTGSTTLYVLKREGRTSKAMWSVGERTVDARVINRTVYDDIKTKLKKAWEPDLLKLAKRNPRAARFVEAKLFAVMDGALVVLAAALDAEEEDGAGVAL